MASVDSRLDAVKRQSAQRALDDQIIFDLLFDGYIEDLDVEVNFLTSLADFIERMLALFTENRDNILDFIAAIR